jgi:two-component sensor histidine kinase
MPETSSPYARNDTVSAEHARGHRVESRPTDEAWAEEVLRALVTSTGAVGGEAFFAALAQHLARAIGVRHVIIAEVSADDPPLCRTLAVWTDGPTENFEYAAERTPCGMTVERGAFTCNEHVQERFPDDSDLVDLAAESYAGVRIESATGQPVGHLCALDDKPMADPDRALAIMRMFAARAGMELERLRAEQQRSMMIAELDHRVKNTLASVLAICDRTVETSGSMTHFAEAFRGRIQSMALAHELLAERNWGGAQLDDIVRRLCSPYRRQVPERVTTRGPAVTLPANTAPAVAMVVHELLTNAAKHGALAVDERRVTLEWTVDDRTRRVRLAWAERNGPPVAPPTHRGVGTEMIEAMVPYQLHGAGSIEFDPAGVRCTLEIPIRNVPGDADTPP